MAGGLFGWRWLLLSGCDEAAGGCVSSGAFCILGKPEFLVGYLLGNFGGTSPF